MLEETCKFVDRYTVLMKDNVHKGNVQFSKELSRLNMLYPRLRDWVDRRWDDYRNKKYKQLMYKKNVEHVSIDEVELEILRDPDKLSYYIKRECDATAKYNMEKEARQKERHLKALEARKKKEDAEDAAEIKAEQEALKNE
jgi:hypothetical protein